jgi:hypothetical protein
MQGEMDLVLNMHVSRSMINKNTTASTHLVRGGLSLGSKEATLGGANEMVYQNALPNNQLVLLDVANGIAKDRRGLARRWLASLLTVQASSTLWGRLDLAATSMKATSLLRMSEDARSHQGLNLAMPKMTETLVPTKEFLLVFVEIAIRFVDSQNGSTEGLGSEWNITVLVGETGG